MVRSIGSAIVRMMTVSGTQTWMLLEEVAAAEDSQLGASLRRGRKH
jgi:hypothetical protein